jgi:hypothetical protein
VKKINNDDIFRIGMGEQRYKSGNKDKKKELSLKW